VWVGKLRKLWDSLSELRNSLCERRLERTVLSPALLPVKTAQFTQFFLSGMTSHSKNAQFDWECTGRLTGEFILLAERIIRRIRKNKTHSWLNVSGKL